MVGRGGVAQKMSPDEINIENRGKKREGGVATNGGVR